jgi:DNA-binding XRE family transcriptional regulator
MDDHARTSCEESTITVTCTDDRSRVERAAPGELVHVNMGRASRGWTLDQLAERSGVSRRMLVSIEQGWLTRASRRCC